MTPDIMEIGKNDIVMVHHNIGDMPPECVDKYCDPIIKKLVDLFGKDHVAFFPVREGDTWDFTIVRKMV
jgi:hypothetical protein